MKTSKLWEDLQKRSRTKKDSTVNTIPIPVKNKESDKVDYNVGHRRCKHPLDQIISSTAKIGELKICQVCGTIVNDPDMREG
jgi:hypothetical protein